MPHGELDSEIEDRKELYSYQQGDIASIFERLDNAAINHHLLYHFIDYSKHESRMIEFYET